jgi:heme exporter protein C
MRSISFLTIAIATVAVLAAGFALAFFYAPEDADQGFIQKIFYLHVPLAICALLGFIVAAVHAIRHLRTGDPIHDARSYVSIHLSVIFGVGVLLTGAIWARGSWGVWWEWREPTLVSFLIVFLLYATYYPLRYAIEDRDRQARYASVFAITAGAFVPLNFLAVRLAEPLIHPRTFSSSGGLPGDMMLAFLVCLAGMALLWVTLVRFELAAKAASADLGRVRRALLGDGAPPAPAPSIAPVGVSATSAMSARPGEDSREGVMRGRSARSDPFDEGATRFGEERN